MRVHLNGYMIHPTIFDELIADSNRSLIRSMAGTVEPTMHADTHCGKEAQRVLNGCATFIDMLDAPDMTRRAARIAIDQISLIFFG